MALGSQQANVDALSGITGLVHEIFVGDVLPGVRWESPTARRQPECDLGRRRQTDHAADRSRVFPVDRTDLR